MPGAKLKKIVSDIKALKIQGASRVRAAVIEGIKAETLESGAKSVSEFVKDIEESMLLLAGARITEPEARTAIKILSKKLREPSASVDALRKSLVNACDSYAKDMQNVLKLIANFGAQKVPRGAVVFTHCHSHTVEAILKKAFDAGNLKKVICTETRPKFQGSITAENLSKYGIPVTMVVDSASRAFIENADLLLTGADAVLANGDVINKIGTSLISLAAKEAGIPHYVATSTHKFSAQPIAIEERAASEIWENGMKNFEIKNPAFDVTEAALIREIICEIGSFAPAKFAEIAGK